MLVRLTCPKCDSPTMAKSDWKDKLPAMVKGLVGNLALRIFYCTECGYVELYYGEEKAG